MRSLLGDAFPAFRASYDLPAGAGLRVNTLKIVVERFRAVMPFVLDPVPWCAAGFTLANDPVVGSLAADASVVEALAADDQAPGKHPRHAAGLDYLQEPSAMVVAQLLDPQPGERVLDLAAAPGGKATHIAALMAGRGLLIANETHSKRAWVWPRTWNGGARRTPPLPTRRPNGWPNDLGPSSIVSCSMRPAPARGCSAKARPR